MPSILQTLKNRPLLLIGLIVAVALLIIFSPLLIVLLLAKTGSGVLLLKTVKLATNTFDVRNLQSTPPGLTDAMQNSQTACFRNSDCTFGPCVDFPNNYNRAVNQNTFPPKTTRCTPPALTVEFPTQPEWSYPICTKNQCTKQYLISPKTANKFLQGYGNFLTNLFPFINPK